MYRMFVLMLGLTLLLAACGAPAAEEPAPPAASEEEAPAASEEEAPAEDEDAAAAEEEAPAASEEEAPAEDEDAAPAEDEDAAASEDEDAAASEEDATGEDAAAGEAVTYQIVPEESSVSYAVDEVFLREGIREVTAVGVTQEIEGEITFNSAQPQESTVGLITIDISAFQSDSERRDNAIRDDWLESATYPLATFEPTAIEGLPESYSDGEEITLQITGDLTVREVTTETTFETVGTISGDEMTGTATTVVQMTDFGFDPPDIAGVLRTENDVAITFDFVARAAE